MGRPERPIDPDAGPVAELAYELRKLRDQAGRPSYRQLARQASFSVTVLSEAAGGRALPTLAVLRAYVRACGADAAPWEERWRHAADQRRAEPDTGGRRAPYRGLASYEVEDTGEFFGRDALTRDLLRRLADGRFLAVFGPSGSGKSSLLRAGLLAAVRRGLLEPVADGPVVLLTPGERPLTALAGRLAGLTGEPAALLCEELLTDPAPVTARALAGHSAGAGLLLVVDQFEELFTLCRDAAERDGFTRALVAAAGADPRIRVVLGIRADFYGHCARWPELVGALRDAQVLVGPLDRDQLRDVIVKPAERAGMTVEGALVATALAEAGAEPGALALVSHALLETWRRSPPGRLTLTAYTEAGGVPHAIASTAEQVYAGCGEDGRPLLRRMLLRLVAVGDGTPDTRRLLAAADLAAGEEAGPAAALIETLARARLVTVDDGSVQLAHEALIEHWPRLGEWLDDSRDGLRVQRRLADAAGEWVRLGHDPAGLYRGTPLAVAATWAERMADLVGLAPVEREFLAAGRAAEATGQAAAARSTRRLRLLVAALLALLVGVSVVGGTTVWQRRTAVAAERSADSGQLASRSGQLASVNPEAAALAAVGAWREQPSEAARSALLSTAACCTSTQASLVGDSARVFAVALSPDGRLLAGGGSDHAVHLWDTADGRPVGVLRGFTGVVEAIAFAPGGHLLAVGCADGSVQLWDPVRRRVIATLAAANAHAVTDLAFSPAGTMLATSSADGRVRLWDTDSHRVERILPGPGGQAGSVAFSPAGRMLAVGGNRAVTLWSLAGPRPAVVQTLTGAAAKVTDVAWNPRGAMIAGEVSDHSVVLWDLVRHRRLVLPGALVVARRGLAFNQTGTTLITSGTIHQLKLWDTATGQLIGTIVKRSHQDTSVLAYDPGRGLLAIAGYAGNVELWQQAIPPFTGDTGPLTGLAVIPGGRLVATASRDRTLRLWTSGGQPVASQSLPAGPNTLAASPDGTLLATAERDGTVSLRDVRGLTQVRQLRVMPKPAAISFAPDGRTLAVAARRTVTIFDTGTGRQLLSLYAGAEAVTAIAFSPGTTLTAVTSRGSVITWNTRTGRVIRRIRPTISGLTAVALSPDGRLLATAGNDGAVTLWDPVTLTRVGLMKGPVGSVHVLTFSSDGRTLADSENQGTILLWDMTSRSLMATLTATGSLIKALAFMPGASTLVSGDGQDGVVKWDLNPADVARADCRMLGGYPGLSQAEALVPGASYTGAC